MSRYSTRRTVAGNDAYGLHLHKSRRALQTAIVGKAAVVELLLSAGGAAGRLAAAAHTREAFALARRLRHFDIALAARTGMRA